MNLLTLSSYPQAIAHIDCDAFFASCEQARDAGLKGRPVVTGKERGIIACASYEAKARGVSRGIRLGDAKKLCPDLVILPSDYETYSIYSERMFSIIRRFTPLVEEYSIDEAFLDLTGLRRLYRASYEEIAKSIKEAVIAELDITVSVGLSLSKTLAKLCSKENKPNGFMAMPGYRIHEYLKTMPLERVCGFGPNTVALLNKYGIKAVLDYIDRPVQFAEKALGKIGVELWRELRGESVYKVSDEKKEKYLSISKTKTFVPASRDRDTVKARLMRNLESACIKLRRHKLSARTITVYLRQQDFSGRGMEANLNRHSQATLDFVPIAAGIFERLFSSDKYYRATGVILSDITDQGIDRHDLFDDPVRIEKLADISSAMDRINSAYGKHTVHIAAAGLVDRESSHPRSELPWRKTGLLPGETARKHIGIPLMKIRV